MINFPRTIGRIQYSSKYITAHLATEAATEQTKPDEFKALNIRQSKQRFQERRQIKITPVPPPRTNQMALDQDWGSVWPGARSFHPATVPLPVRQGFTERRAPPPSKFANAELMKIPNFLHLTPPVIKRQCEALKQFCTAWPKELDSNEKLERLFPIEVTSSDYCHSSPTIRDPMARIVTIKFKLSCLDLNSREKDKFRRLVGDRYNEENDTVTIVTDKCPLKKQNYDYAMYLLTALYHESKKIEPWEDLKTDADMEYYDWEKSVSKTSVEMLFTEKSENIANIKVYSEAVSNYMNEGEQKIVDFTANILNLSSFVGENDYTISKYEEAVKKLLNI